MNALIRENFQRNFILNGLTQANDEDWVIISDLDEIPNLDMNDLKQCKNEIVFFKFIAVVSPVKFSVVFTLAGICPPHAKAAVELLPEARPAHSFLPVPKLG